jgi:hypothetical protein
LSWGYQSAIDYIKQGGGAKASLRLYVAALPEQPALLVERGIPERIYYHLKFASHVLHRAAELILSVTC